MFADDELRCQVHRLALRPRSDRSREPITKRTKRNDGEPSPSVELGSQLSQLVDLDLDSPLDELQPHILSVAPFPPAM